MAFPGQMPPLFGEAVQCFQRGDLAGAETRCRRLIQADPRFLPAHDVLGNIMLRKGAFQEAEEAFSTALRINPGMVEIRVNLASAQLRLRKFEETVTNARQALAQAPGHRRALAVLAPALRQSGCFDEAVECAKAAVAADPKFPPAHAELGAAYEGLGRLDDALACYEQALRLAPDFAEAWCAKGKVLAAREQEGASEAFVEALRLKPGLAAAHAGLGCLLDAEGRHEDALAAYRHAVECSPDDAELRFTLGCSLQRRGHGEPAALELARALDLRPDFAAAACRLGDVFQVLGRLRDAAEAYRRAFAADQTMVAALLGMGRICLEQGRDGEAVEHLDQAYAMEPEHPFVLDMLVLARLQSCSWDGLDTLRAALRARIEQGRIVVNPFVAILAGIDAVGQLAAAAGWGLSVRPPDAPLFRHSSPGAAEVGRKIRIGYLSADFHDHATTHLMAGLWEHHDRRRFELHAYCLGHDDGSAMRGRVVAAFDGFTSVAAMGAKEAAERIHADGIDILVDLKGYTNLGNPAIAAYRPAPIQVNYLGYPGTMGVPFMDYVVVDGVVAPAAEPHAFAEKVVRLPHCYQPNDSRRAISPEIPARADLGLPERGFVFCSFNNPNKFTRETFALWMRLLAKVPGSVLWLLDPNAAVRANLVAEAQAGGIDADRLVFAGRLPLAEHLGRHRAADLFLDSLPYNAHTTASDSLWAGLPLLTCTGTSFAGRVAASLLKAVGLPELITTSMEDYEALALRLARDPTLLGGLRRRLEEGRATSPLFDTALYTRHLEAAYLGMWERWCAGKSPDSFAVPA